MNLKTIILCVIAALIITGGIFYVATLEKNEQGTQQQIKQHGVTEGSFAPVEFPTEMKEESATGSIQCQTCSKITDPGPKAECMANFGCE